jgi:hypothetical protein
LLPSCRPGLPASVFPDQDTLLCDPRTEIRSHHLLTAVASQNYGQNSYRVRQPFDFEGRTGRIVFDAEAHMSANGNGWVSLEVTEDPAATPSYAFFGNDEGGAIPRNGFELQFSSSCGEGYSVATRVALKHVHVFRNYADMATAPDNPTCIGAREGRLNRFEVRVSRQLIEVWGTPASDDGATFAPPILMYRGAVDLPFSRGYVHITTHNHASLKYTHPPQDWPQRVDATLARWDNVGFDGPVISNWREYEVADALTPNHFDPAARPEDDDPYNPTHAAVDLGYIVPDAADGPSATLHLRDVNLQDVTAARLSVTTWYPNTGAIDKYVLRYRFNGRAWHDHPLGPAEVALFRGPTVTGPTNVSPMIRGALNQMIDVPPADLVAGENTLEFVTANVPQNYPAGVVNVDLILTTR